MSGHPTPSEAARLAALRHLEILDTPSEPIFDDLTTVASRVCETPIALLTLIDAERQWFKSRVGLEVAETHRSLAFCHHTIQADELMVVGDALQDPRFVDNALVVGQPDIRFYAGAPITTRGGQTIGTIAVIDRQPRHLEQWQLDTLRDLAGHAARLLELRSEELRFRRFIELAPEGVLVTDAGGLVRYANPEAARMLRRGDPHELLGSALTELVSADGAQACERAIAEVVEGGLRPMVETTLVPLVGEPVPVELALGRLSLDPEPTVRVGIRDSSERLRQEQELRTSQALLQTLVDNAPAAVFIKDLGGRYLVANQVMMEQAVDPTLDARGLTDHDLFPPELAERYRAADALALRYGVQQIEETTGEHDERAWSLVKFPLLDSDGAPYGVGGIATEITERRRAEQQARELRERLQHREHLESLGQLAGGIAHDFNNLLAIILAATEHAMTAAGTAGAAGAAGVAGVGNGRTPLQEDLDHVRAAALRAADLVQQLLVFARRQPTEPQLVDLNHAVRTTVSLLRRTLGSDISTELELDDSVPRVLVDPTHLDQVLVNLALNARDAMTDGGTLTIATRPAESDAPTPALVELRVSDTGAGMPDEVVAKAFEPFFTTKPPGTGTGLGLPTVFGIVTGSGGSVDIASTPREGTTVQVWLPTGPKRAAESTTPPKRTAASTTSGAAPPGRSILVVEDEAANLAIVTRILEREGYTVHTAVDGAAALEVIAGHGDELGLVLSDVTMPGMSGTELAEHIRLVRPGLPTLLMSGLPDAGRTATDAPQLLKPFGAAELIERVREAIAPR
jgi:two-component system, cell cycle sensor histidine kinase and response regulator CckA